MVIAECSGWPISITDFSESVAVGQACTQAPQETHSESQECFVHAGGHAAVEAAAGDRQREGALHLLAGAHAAIADDALRRIVGEIGVRLVLGLPLGVGGGAELGRDVVCALIAVAHVAQADGAGHVLQLAIAVGGAGEAIERMIGDVELHHAVADLLQARRLRLDDDAWCDRRGA